MSDRLTQIVERLRGSGFRELAGARVTATVPVDEGLLNEFIAASLPRGGAVRDLTLHPQAPNRLGVRVKLARPDFLPPISATILIERQPELPGSPLLGCRITGLAGLLAFAGPLFSIGSVLPPGVRLEGDLLTLDIAVLMAERGFGEWFSFVKGLRVNTVAGRLMIDVDAAVPS